jgi:hypothetical protein
MAAGSRYYIAMATPVSLVHMVKAAKAGGAKRGGGVLVWAAEENVGDLVMSGKNCCTCRGDLKHFIIRARRRVGWWEFSADC